MKEASTVSQEDTSTEPIRDKEDLLGSYVEALFDGSRVMMHVVDRDFNIVKVNRRWLQVMGYDEGEVLGHRPTEFLTEESRRLVGSDILPVFIRVGSDHGVAVDLTTKNGRALNYLLDAEASFDTTGIVHGFAAIYDPHNPAERAAASSTMAVLRQLILMQSQVENGMDQEISQFDLADTRLVEVCRSEVHSEQPGVRDDARLSTRELEVLLAVATGARNKEIAQQLHVGARTVKFHIENIYQKLGVHSRTHAVRVATERRLLNNQTTLG